MTDKKSSTPGGRRFEFDRDSFAFANELLWAYQFDPQTGRTHFRKREPKPEYALRCFVLTRAARQFLYHARFEADLEPISDEIYRDLIRQAVRRNPRTPCTPERQIVIPGYAGLREFSVGREKLLKSECGGAWRSYVLRSHWRMVFPISRTHQTRTARALVAALEQSRSPIIHLVQFPSLTINHGMILFAVAPTPDGFKFSAYDPNNPQFPAELTFDRRSQTFFLSANAYWAGGELKVIEIFRSWLM
jgi:hypothetical protein